MIYHKLPQLRFFLLFPSSSTLRPLTPTETGNFRRNAPFLHCCWLDHSHVGHPDAGESLQQYPRLTLCALPQLWQDSHAALSVKKLCSFVKNAITN